MIWTICIFICVVIVYIFLIDGFSKRILVGYSSWSILWWESFKLSYYVYNLPKSICWLLTDWFYFLGCAIERCTGTNQEIDTKKYRMIDFYQTIFCYLNIITCILSLLLMGGWDVRSRGRFDRPIEEGTRGMRSIGRSSYWGEWPRFEGPLISNLSIDIYPWMLWCLQGSHWSPEQQGYSSGSREPNRLDYRGYWE